MSLRSGGVDRRSTLKGQDQREGKCQGPVGSIQWGGRHQLHEDAEIPAQLEEMVSEPRGKPLPGRGNSPPGLSPPEGAGLVCSRNSSEARVAEGGQGEGTGAESRSRWGGVWGSPGPREDVGSSREIGSHRRA